MSEFFTLRARRFHALHDLLTGGLREYPQSIPPYLAEDVGLPASASQNDVAGPFGALIRRADR